MRNVSGSLLTSQYAMTAHGIAPVGGACHDPRPMTELRGAVCVVTGSASGIGRATALALAREGSDVVIADIDRAGAEETAGAISTEARVVPTDVARRSDIEALVDDAIAWKGHCDV